MNFKAGTLLQDGRYVIDFALGHGYFGTTYRAMHANLVQPVVVKTLGDGLREGDRYEDFKCQFIEQARCLAKCPSPYLPRLLDIFEEDDRPFVVMDYIPGATLSQLVQGGRPLPVDRALSYIRQIGAALEVMHAEGLLHRDLQPDHAIRQFGTDCITTIEIGFTRDFTDGINQTHSNLLAAGYAAPEQYDIAAPRTVGTDVYALAAVLYFLLVGHAPIAAPLRDRVPQPSARKLNPAVPTALDAAIQAGLAINPAQRPASVEAFLATLPEPVVSSTLSPKQPSPPSRDLPPFARPWVPAVFAVTSILSALSGAGSVMLLRASNAQVDDNPYHTLRNSPEFEAFRSTSQGAMFEHRVAPERPATGSPVTAEYDRHESEPDSTWDTPDYGAPAYDGPVDVPIETPIEAINEVPAPVPDVETDDPEALGQPLPDTQPPVEAPARPLNSDLGTSYELEATPSRFDPTIEFAEPEPLPEAIPAPQFKPEPPAKMIPPETVPLRSLQHKSVMQSMPNTLS